MLEKEKCSTDVLEPKNFFQFVQVAWVITIEKDYIYVDE